MVREMRFGVGNIDEPVVSMLSVEENGSHTWNVEPHPENGDPELVGDITPQYGINTVQMLAAISGICLTYSHATRKPLLIRVTLHSDRCRVQSTLRSILDLSEMAHYARDRFAYLQS